VKFVLENRFYVAAFKIEVNGDLLWPFFFETKQKLQKFFCFGAFFVIF